MKIMNYCQIHLHIPYFLVELLLWEGHFGHNTHAQIHNSTFNVCNVGNVCNLCNVFNVSNVCNEFNVCYGCKEFNVCNGFNLSLRGI